MAVTVLVLPLMAAILHATWNALVKTAVDRLFILASIALVTSLTGAIMISVFPSPHVGSWPFIAASIIIKYAYYILMFYAYRTGELSFVYPVARGVAPPLVAVGAAFLADEQVASQAQLGIAAVSAGILSLAWGGFRSAPSEILLPLAIGVAIATFSLCDGMGVRRAGSPFGFMGWLFLLEAPIVGFAAYRRRGSMVTAIAGNWLHGLAAGIASVLAYGLVVYAAAYAPLALVSALRETSIVIATLIGAIFLREANPQYRIMTSTLVIIGVALILTSR